MAAGRLRRRTRLRGGEVTRVAAVDCGTNTLRLLVADLDPDTGSEAELDRRTTIVRLGQDVDRTGVFSAAALERTFAALDGFASVVDSLDVERRRFVATSAARDVENRAEFADGVLARFGTAPEVISGAAEARLTFAGATRQLDGRRDIARPLLVVDIGGGSTELVTRPASRRDIVGTSLDVGSVRLTERYLHSDPPTPAQVESLVSDVDAALDTVKLPLDRMGTAVGVAGTVTTMAAMVLGLTRYDRARVDLAPLPLAELQGAIQRVVKMTVAERRSLPFMHPDRADVIAAGALILDRVTARVGLPTLLCSVRDILDGIAWSALP
ncbi:MAG TPA: Ppx/GppA phosphatase family protein [Nocardioidaceae bacterium]|nr:Ppx/GppA phosphatase family protein [Nocardioidaceae bacterium]